MGLQGFDGTESSSKGSWRKSLVEAHLWFTEDAMKVEEEEARKGKGKGKGR